MGHPHAKTPAGTPAERRNVAALVSMEQEAISALSMAERFSDKVARYAGRVWSITGHALWFGGVGRNQQRGRTRHPCVRSVPIPIPDTRGVVEGDFSFAVHPDEPKASGPAGGSPWEPQSSDQSFDGTGVGKDVANAAKPLCSPQAGEGRSWSCRKRMMYRMLSVLLVAVRRCTPSSRS